MKPRDLPGKWREEAEIFRRRGAIEAAATLEDVAAELDASFADWQMEALTLHEASEETGYSYSHLQRLVADGEIPNVGEVGAPRIRRGDLPRKPSRGTRSGPVDLADEILGRRVG